MEKTKVTAAQFFSVIYLTLLTGVFMFLSSSSNKIGSTDTVIRPFLFALFNFILTVPLYFYIKKSNKTDVFTFLNNNSRVLSVTVGIIFLICFFISVIRTVARLDLFLSSAMFKNTNTLLFIVGIIGICCCIAYLGFGTVCRGSSIFSVLVIAGTLFISVTAVVKSFDILNFTPLFQDGLKDFIKDTVSFSFFPMELSGLLLFTGSVEGDYKKSYIKFLIFSVITTAFASFCVVGTLGRFADTQLFPFYTLSTVEGIGLIERLDALESSAWLFCVISCLSFEILCFKKSFNNIFNSDFKILPLIICFISSSAACGYISYNIERFNFLFSPAYLTVPYVLCVVLIPVICLAVYYFNKKKRNENIE